MPTASGRVKARGRARTTTGHREFASLARTGPKPTAIEARRTRPRKGATRGDQNKPALAEVVTDAQEASHRQGAERAGNEGAPRRRAARNRSNAGLPVEKSPYGKSSLIQAERMRDQVQIPIEAQAP